MHYFFHDDRHELDDTQEINYRAVMKAIAETDFTGYIGHEFMPTRDPLEGLHQATTVCDVQWATFVTVPGFPYGTDGGQKALYPPGCH